MREFLVGFITAFAFQASPAECLGFGLFCSLPHLFVKNKILSRLSHELGFWIPLWIASLFLKEVGKDLTISVPDFLPNTWAIPLVISWKAVTAGALFHMIIDLISGHGTTIFTRRVPALSGGNPWNTIPSLLYVIVTGTLSFTLNRFIPLVLAAGNGEIVLSYGVLFPPLFLASSWLWIRCGWRFQTQFPDGKMLIDIRKLAENWTRPCGSESTGNSAPKDPPSETETKGEDPQECVSSGSVEAVNRDTVDFKNSWVRKLYEEFFEPYENFWEESGLTAVLMRALRMLDAEGGAPSVAGDTYDHPEIRSQYDLLSRISLAEHTYNVVRLASERLKKDLPEAWHRVFPKLVLACVFHDMGKMPSVRKQTYVTGKHPIDGANLADLLLREADHPWREPIADLVRKHHEKPGDNAPLEHMILVWADKEARLEETTALAKKIKSSSGPPEKEGPDPGAIPTVVSRRETTKKGRPETKPLPADFPFTQIFQKILERTNTLINQKSWVAISQPDGNVYIYAEALHKAISDTAKEAGYEDPFYHSTDEETKRSCLQSFYDEFRKHGWVPEKLVSKGFYGNFFRLWNPLKRGFTCTFYIPLRISAFEVDLDKLEKKRKKDAILSQVKIFGVAPLCELRGKCDGKCPFGR